MNKKTILKVEVSSAEYARLTAALMGAQRNFAFYNNQISSVQLNSISPIDNTINIVITNTNEIEAFNFLIHYANLLLKDYHIEVLKLDNIYNEK